MKTTKELLTQLAFVIIAALCSLPTAQAQTQEDLVDRVSKAVGVSLPSEYLGKVKEYVKTDELWQRESAAAFTEMYIAGQMKENWGISKQNQLLFIWDAIYEQVTKKNFYDGEDGNKQRLEDFENAMETIEACGKKYKQDFIDYMNRRSAEADRRSAEADRRSAEADRMIEEAHKKCQQLEKEIAGIKDNIAVSANEGIQGLILIYNYLSNVRPQVLSQNNINTKELKDMVHELLSLYQKHSIDYKAILRKELRDEKKVNDLLKFYGIE